jgi:hypothetical protein
MMRGLIAQNESAHSTETGAEIKNKKGTGRRPLQGQTCATDLPDGQKFWISEFAVWSLLKKYSDFQKSRLSLYPLPFHSTEGRSRDRHERGMDAMGRSWCRKTTGATAYGEVVWSWTPSAGVDGGYQAWHAGESTKEAVKPLRRKRRDDPVNLW